MTANTVNGGGNGVRAGAQTLVLLASPLNAAIIEALQAGPQTQADLRKQTGLPAQTTLRSQLKRLGELGVVEKHRRERFPGVLDYELSPVGRELLGVVETLQAWLDRAPDGPLELGGGAAKGAVKALADGWSTKMLRALAPGPRSLTELDRMIAEVSYPSLERRLGAMRLAGQIEARKGNGRGTPYAVTNWLRESIAPLTAAARWERRHQAEAARPLGRLDVETGMLLAIPRLPALDDLDGACRLAVELSANGATRLAGITVEVGEGAIVSCTTKLERATASWAHGSAPAWLDAIVAHDPDRLEFGGDCRLARAIADGLGAALYPGSPSKTP